MSFYYYFITSQDTAKKYGSACGILYRHVKTAVLHQNSIYIVLFYWRLGDGDIKDMGSVFFGLIQDEFKNLAF